MKLMNAALSLCFAVLACGCQSWTTVTLSVDGVDVQNVGAAVETAVVASGFAPCADWNVSVAGADVCLGGRVDGNSITVAGFQKDQAYDVKIGFYAPGRIDSAVRERIVARCKEAMVAAAPGARVTRTESGELLQVRRIQ